MLSYLADRVYEDQLLISFGMFQINRTYQFFVYVFLSNHIVLVIDSGQTNLIQTFFNDPNVTTKIDFSRPVSFVIHGWLGGLNGGNIFLPAQIRSSSGVYTFTYICIRK